MFMQAVIPALLMNVYIVGLNQVYDIEIDKVSVRGQIQIDHILMISIDADYRNHRTTFLDDSNHLLCLNHIRLIDDD